MRFWSWVTEEENLCEYFAGTKEQEEHVASQPSYSIAQDLYRYILEYRKMLKQAKFNFNLTYIENPFNKYRAVRELVLWEILQLINLILLSDLKTWIIILLNL